MCSHIIILGVTLKLVEFPQTSMQIPIDQIRKRGRPRLCEVSDQVLDKISNQLFKNVISKITLEFLSKNKSKQIINQICLFILFIY
jgi:hypothetical protein